MGKIEEVRKITHPECFKWFREGCPIPKNPACKECVKQARRICQLFELKSLIPKPLEGTPYIEDIGEFVDSAAEEEDWWG